MLELIKREEQIIGREGEEVEQKIQKQDQNGATTQIYEGEEEVEPWMDIELPKIDGSNLTLVYRRGKLKLAITRGCGQMAFQ